MFIGNGEKVKVELLKSGFLLELFDTIYVPCTRCSLISFTRLDKQGYCCSFGDVLFQLLFEIPFLFEWLF